MITQETIFKFISAIRNKQIVVLRFYSKEDVTIIQRTCAPMDFGPSRRAKIKNDRFHLWDYDSDTRSHILSLSPEQVVEIIVLDEHFNPEDIVTWDTQKSSWFVERNWGDVS